MFKEAADPSNIKWENRHVKKGEFQKRWFIAAVKLFIAVMIAFGLTIAVKTHSIQYSSKYSEIDCEEITQVYGGENFERYAFLDYQAQRDHKAKSDGGTLPVIGLLKCFCDVSDKPRGQLYTQNGETAAICNDYLLSKTWNKWSDQVMAIVIVGINFSFKTIVSYVVK